MLCLERLQAVNRIILVCGHEFCWAAHRECEGRSRWFSVGKTTCPTSRRNTSLMVDLESAVLRETLDASLVRCRAVAAVEREPFSWSALPPPAAALKQKMGAAGVPAVFKAETISEALRELLGLPAGSGA